MVAVTPLRGALLLYTLHHAAEVRTPPYVAGEAHTGKPSPAEAKLARAVIAALMQPLDLVTFQDAYQVDVRRLIDAKIAGQEIVQPAVPEAPAVLSLRDALTRSLDLVSAAKKQPAKASPEKRKRAS